MCGIIGYSVSGTKPDLKAGLQRIRHRGPDDSGIASFPDTGIALGHARLSILDLSESGAQPMSTKNGRFTISYNGELYNYREHRACLERSGVIFKGESDTEVLLAMLDTQGLDCLPELNGIFALAIADHTEQSVTLIRDRFGVKPLYYCAGNQGVMFASEVKALVAMGAVTGEPDGASISRYLSFMWCPGNGLPVKSVRKLGPGEAMTLREGRVIAHWNWYQPANHSCHKTRLSKLAAIKAVRESLRRAVCRQMMADVPVGAFLSGGLDSSAIVAFAREQNPHLRCFTIATLGNDAEGIEDDLPYAKRVADHLGVGLDVVSVTPDEIINELRNMVYHLDEPLADPAALNVLFISRLARAHGIKVLLSGSGGDDLFTGYRRHLAVKLQAYWQWLPRVFRTRLARSAVRLDKRRPSLRRLAKLLESMGHDGYDVLISYFLWTNRDDVIGLLHPGLRERIAGVDCADPMREHLDSLGPDCSELDRLLALDQRFFLTDHNLAYTDKMSMAAGVEVRVPFLDNDLVKLATKLPDRLKQRGREGKWVLKKAMEPYLPREVIYRPKTGFGAPLRRWLNCELRDFVDSTLSLEDIKRRGLFDPTAVRELIEKTRSGSRDGSYTIFSLLCIELWFQVFVDSKTDRGQTITDVAAT